MTPSVSCVLMDVMSVTLGRVDHSGSIPHTPLSGHYPLCYTNTWPSALQLTDSRRVVLLVRCMQDLTLLYIGSYNRSKASKDICNYLI